MGNDDALVLITCKISVCVSCNLPGRMRRKVRPRHSQGELKGPRGSAHGPGHSAGIELPVERDFQPARRGAPAQWAQGAARAAGAARPPPPPLALHRERAREWGRGRGRGRARECASPRSTPARRLRREGGARGSRGWAVCGVADPLAAAAAAAARGRGGGASSTQAAAIGTLRPARGTN